MPHHTEEGSEPGHLIPLEGLYNVRDLGGYPAAGGRQVKEGVLYRAGDLHTPTPGDLAVLEGLRLNTIVDFRGTDEKKQEPDVRIQGVVHIHEVPIETGNIVDLLLADRSISGEAQMEGMYRRLAHEARPQYREFFKILANPTGTPLLFHCSAGKDRTGLGAALILSALGVDRDLVYADYLLSRVYLQDKYNSWLAKAPYLEPLMSVRQEYLEVAFTVIDQEYGGVDQYLRQDLGADPALLRELYTV
ncbi:MAG: tyrosine-protein phosphatase [Treponema sp.]|jgi:protein-tyrosine phosphatase|nr:tyrosine-protein phosphatase [Treponema sp.]